MRCALVRDVEPLIAVEMGKTFSSLELNTWRIDSACELLASTVRNFEDNKINLPA
jgi:hypothetical protein